MAISHAFAAAVAVLVAYLLVENVAPTEKPRNAAVVPTSPSSIPEVASPIEINTNSKFGVVLDAGSSGTRVYVFQWDPAQPTATIQQVYSQRWRPGLSSHATTDRSATTAAKIQQDVVDDLAKVLAVAVAKVPREQHSDCTISLAATAGLRLLPEEDRQSVLAGVRRALHASPFVFQDDWAGIIDGQTEAVYMWVAANLLAGSFAKTASGQDNSYGTVELGGGSTQITLPLRGPAAASLPSTPHTVVVPTTEADGSASQRTLFGFSLLGFGQNEAFKSFIRWFATEKSPGETRNPCLMVGQVEPFADGDVDIELRGPSDLRAGDEAGFAECAALTSEFVEWLLRLHGQTGTVAVLRGLLDAGAELGDFLGFDNFPKDVLSLFILRGGEGSADTEGGSSSVEVDGTVVVSDPFAVDLQHVHSAKRIRLTLDQLLSRAGHVCGRVGWEDAASQLAHKEQADRNRKICFGAGYISALLSQYGFSSSTPVTFAQEINGAEANWPLGAMAHRLGIIWPSSE